MPFDTNQTIARCPICESQANVRNHGGNAIVNCLQCGDFRASHDLVEDWPRSGGNDATKRALASHVIRLLQTREKQPALDLDCLLSFLKDRAPTSPAEGAASLILLIGDALKARPGDWYQEYWRAVTSHAGLITVVDTIWLTKGVVAAKLVEMSSPTFDIQAGNPQDKWMGRLTFAGWERYGELTRTRDKSNFAFLARKFANPDLDKVYAECLKPAVQKTGYDLRVVTQRAGLIDAIIESEIRNCKFLVADLSDGNAGSYWEAGFAEGLGKPVFYICKELDERGTKIQTHFDTAHRMTIRWRPDPASFQQTENELKAVIRNTLLGEVSQVDVM